MDLDSRQLIDAQFDRAVEIVQGLPKTGPIQTGYEEKLTMYSLYKQATVGNVQPPRPSVWDMLGRAKWDAWAKHKDLDPYEAKWLYVDALLKVLRKYSDKTVAMDLVRELESYTGDPSNLVMSGTTSRSPGSSSSGSTASDVQPPGSRYDAGHFTAHLRNDQSDLVHPPRMHGADTDEGIFEDEEERVDRVPPPAPSMYAHSQINRPQSSLSSRRYRTPMAGSLLMTSPPPAGMVVPATQPQPAFQAPSAFAQSSSPSIPSTYPTTTVSYPDPLSRTSPLDHASAHSYPPRPGYRASSQQQFTRPYSLQSGMTPRPTTLIALEHAVESVQAHLAALTERLEILEGITHRSTASLSMHGSNRSPSWSGAGRGSPSDGRGEIARWDLDDMGMWSLVLNPLARAIATFRQLMGFLAHNENRSPTLIVVRRLFLDISFILCLLSVVKMAWRRSGMRRKEVLSALRVLWNAVLGHKRPRIMIDRSV